ncbi:MFS transporter [Gordonia sp. (in: high G+C Gram-positive bacteria)]|uniref:MFS transporter n=1 Tax=Gordonia sp. (in: high G+C Gram-positive bacteria) TaxID=84139 RepID=UPI0039E6B5D3
MDWRSIWLVFIVCLAVSMVVAAMAALNTALQAISADPKIAANASEQTWIIDGYTLMLAALLLPAGAIGDRLGRRGVMISGLVVFGIASLLGVFAQNAVQLIGTRALAGAAAAFIMPTTLSLITSNVPVHRRPLAISVWSAIAGIGAIAGFFVTGLLLKYFGKDNWQAILITFAVSAAITAAVCLTIGTSKDASPDPFDWIGSLTSVVAIFAIVFGLLEAPHHGWTSPLVLSTLIGGTAMAAVFCLIQIRIKYPLLDVKLFANRAFGAGSLSVMLQFFASFAVFFLALQQLQLIFGYTALASAVALFPLVLGVGVFALLGNWLAVRYHSLRFVLAVGVFFAGLGILLMGVIKYTQYWQMALLLVILAVGIGLATAPSTTAIMQNTPLDDQGVGSAVNDTARELGAAIGIALAGSILAAGYANRIESTAETARQALSNPATGGDPAKAMEAAEGIRNSLGGATHVADHLTKSLPPNAPAEQVAQVHSLSEKILDGAQAAFTTPMHTSFIILGAILIAGGAFLAWFAPRRMVPLTDAERAAEQAAADQTA